MSDIRGNASDTISDLPPLHPNSNKQNNKSPLSNTTGEKSTETVASPSSSSSSSSSTPSLTVATSPVPPSISPNQYPVEMNGNLNMNGDISDPSSSISSLSTSPTNAQTPSSATSSSSSLGRVQSSTLSLTKNPALTQSMSDAARIDPKSFPYQQSKDAPSASSDPEWIILEATPADPRFAHETVHVQISRIDAAYQLKPIHCGRQVVFLNAQDMNFYKRELKSPSLVVWILCALTFSQSHGLKRLFESGWRQNIQVKVMEVNKFELVASKDGLENILYEGQALDLPDCIFNRVGASVTYFGLAVIRQLENMGCLILNTLKSIEISRDKMLTVQHLAAHGLPIPKTILAKFPMNLSTIAREFEYPIIIKKVSGSQGKGIIKVDSHSQLEDLVDMLDTGKPLIFQEFIQASSGRDLRVFVIGGRVVGAMMRIAPKGNFKANVHQGGLVKPIKISPQVEWLVLETVKIIGLDIAGVDLLIDKNTYKICEVNSSPGFEGLEKALGENIAIKMFLYMKMRLGVWRRGVKGKNISVNVPVEEVNEELTENGSGNVVNSNNISGSSSNNMMAAVTESVNENQNNVISPVSNSESSTDRKTIAPSPAQMAAESDKYYKTLPRNRSMKRTSGGTGSSG